MRLVLDSQRQNYQFMQSMMPQNRWVEKEFNRVGSQTVSFTSQRTNLK